MEIGPLSWLSSSAWVLDTYTTYIPKPTTMMHERTSAAWACKVSHSRHHARGGNEESTRKKGRKKQESTDETNLRVRWETGERDRQTDRHKTNLSRRGRRGVRKNDWNVRAPKQMKDRWNKHDGRYQEKREGNWKRRSEKRKERERDHIQSHWTPHQPQVPLALFKEDKRALH